MEIGNQILTNERGDKDCKGVFFGFYSKMHYDCDETHLRGKKETLLSLLFSSKFIFAEFLKNDIY